MPGAIGIDKNPALRPDIVHDITSCPFPLESNRFDKIYAKHVIEYLKEPADFLKEIYRLLKPGGAALITTPHFSSHVAYSRPQRTLVYSYETFNNIAKPKDAQSLRQRIAFCGFHRAIGVAALANKFPRAYEKFWTFIFPAENITIEFQKG